MPGRNAKGPRGLGPLSGRGLGLCRVKDQFYHHGNCRGFAYRYDATNPSKEDLVEEKKILQNRIDELNQILNA